MIAEINELGFLTITPETSLEAYALKQWGRENVAVDDNGLQVNGAKLRIEHVAAPRVGSIEMGSVTNAWHSVK